MLPKRQRLRSIPPLVGVVLLLATGSCKQIGLAPHEPDPETVKLAPEEREILRRVSVQHILISFDGAGVAGVTRSKKQAEALAGKVFEQVQRGRRFEDARELHTDDRQGSDVYKIVNWGVNPHKGEMSRDSLAQDFTTKAFSLGVGRIALVPYDPKRSPFGWHIVKRVK